jgi:hypothetical protein
VIYLDVAYNRIEIGIKDTIKRKETLAKPGMTRHAMKQTKNLKMLPNYLQNPQLTLILEEALSRLEKNTRSCSKLSLKNGNKL